MKRGDIITVDISEIDSKGDGRGFVEEREVVVRRAVPGDRVEARIAKKRRGRLNADMVRLVDCAMERTEPVCAHFGLCGGCRWQDVHYADQLRIKEQMVRNALVGQGFADVEIPPAIAVDAPFFYRNKMEFSFGSDREGRVQLGLHVRGRFNRIFDVEECHLQSPLSNRIVGVVRSAANDMGLSAYNLKTHEGLLRFLVIRDAKNSGQTLVNLVVSSYPDEGVDQLVEHLIREVPELDSLVVTLHSGKAQVAKGEREFVISGGGAIEESCGGIRFDISPQSFFQTNSLQAERLYALIREWAGNQLGRVLDLYCGTGSIGLHLAPLANEVVGIEVVEEAVADARINAERNGVHNCSFIAGAAEDVLNDVEKQQGAFDLVVVDPPRPGLHRKVLDALGRMQAARLLYVSCNPQTLAENVLVLREYGYAIERVQPVDMFPQTPHCEVVCELVKLD